VIESENKVNDIFHTFSINQQTTNDIFEYPKHFACLIVFEEVYSKNKKKLYIGKALVLTSIYPYFAMFRRILYIIFSKIKEVNSCALEIFIINLLLSLERPTSFDKLISLDHHPTIKIEKKVFLPLCDLNILKFFTLFSVKDFLVLAEKFLKNEKIYVFSKDITLLQPTMFVFLSLMFPLNITFRRDYYPLLLIDDIMNKTLLYESGNQGVILLINSELNLEFFKENFEWQEDNSMLIVDLDTTNVYERIIQLFYIGKIFEREGIDVKTHILELDNEYINLSDISNEITNFLKSYKNKNKGKCSYFDDIYTEDNLYEKIQFVKKFFFTYFCKIINFYVDFVKFDCELESNKAIKKKFTFNNQGFLDYAEKVLPKNIDFYKELVDNTIFRMISSKVYFDNDPDLFNYIFMEELVNISRNKNLVYLDPYKYVKSINYQDQAKKFTIDEKTFDFINPKEYFYKYENLNDVFSGKINDDLKITYLLVPKFDFNDFFQSQFLLSFQTTTDVHYSVLSKKESILLNELEILWKFMNKSDLDLDFTESNTLIYLFLLTFKINSFRGEPSKQNQVFTALFNVLRSMKFKINFLYSFIYDLIISNNVSQEVEMEFLHILIELQINPSYFIVFRNNDTEQNLLIFNDNRVDLNRYLDIEFKLLHNCKYFDSANLKTYLSKVVSFNSSNTYCKCNYASDLTITIKYLEKNEEQNNLFSPLLILQYLLEFIHKKKQEDTEEITLESWVSENEGYFEIVLFYFKNLDLNIMSLCQA
jgi:hypothetical protein